MGRPFTAMVIDDDSSARNILEKFLGVDERVVVLEGLSSTVDAIDVIMEQKPDVLFLDINMPYEDGLRFAHRLKASDISPMLVFCTAFRSYALDAFELKPLGFLVKPFGVKDVAGVIDAIDREIINENSDKSLLQDKRKMTFRFHSTNGLVFLKHSDILWADSSTNYTLIYTTKGEEIRIRQTLLKVYNYLGKELFLKVNRSSIVNIDYISQVDRGRKTCLVKTSCFEREFAVSNSCMTDLDNLLFLIPG